MKHTLAALSAVRALADSDLADAALEAARALSELARAERHVDEQRFRLERTAIELREVTGRGRLDPALVASLRRCYQSEARTLSEKQQALDHARAKERNRAAALAATRNRLHSLDKAIAAERRRGRLQMEVRESIAIDDAWLQQILGGRRS